MLSTLLSQHYALDFIFDLMRDSHNGKIIDAIVDDLSQGKDIATALKDFLPRLYRTYFDALIHVLPLDATLHQCERLLQTKKSQQLFWIKQTLPSLILLVISVAGMLIFRMMGIPMIETLANSFHQTLSWLQPLDQILGIFSFIVILILLLMGILLIMLVVPQGLRMIMRIAHRLSSHHIVVQYVSVQFSVYFNLCLKAGVSTIDTLNLCSGLKHSAVSLLSKQLLECLSNGQSFQDALHQSGLDDTLIKFLTLSEYSGQASSALDAYESVTTMLIQRKSNRMAKIIQIGCYGCIGGLIICIYQVLFLPMNIIANM